MFRAVFLAFWILHIRFSASAPPTNNVAVRAEASAGSHPFLTGVKFVPFKAASSENAVRLEPIPPNTASIQAQLSAVNNGPGQNLKPRPQNLLPLNSLPTELLDTFSLLPSSAKTVSSTKKGSFLPPQNKNADSASLTGFLDAKSGDIVNLAAAVNLPALNVTDFTNTLANDGAKFVSDAILLPLPGAQSAVANVSGQLVPSAFLPSVSVNDLKNPSLPPASGFANLNLAFDPLIASSRKLQPPEPVSLSFEPVQLSERIALPRQSPAEAPQTKNLLPIPSDLPADVKLIPIPPQNPAVAAKMAIELLPPKADMAELIDTLSAGGYGALASQMAAALNASTVKQDLPLVFQRLAAPQKPTHSPKTDVEVFGPLMPEKPAQPPFQPGMPVIPPQYPFSPGGAYPSDEPPFVLNDYPAYPPLLPEDPQTEKPFMPAFPTLPPATRSTEDLTRPTEDTTRATEETTPQQPKSTPTVPKFTPWVPKNTPFVPKNTPWMPKNTPVAPKYTPPQNTPPRQPPVYTPDASGHSWITRYYPGYPPTTKLPKGMPSPIWPMFTPRPLNPRPNANQVDMVTPFMEKLISATSTAATSTAAIPTAAASSVQVLGEPSVVEPKYKLAVVSDYKNYDMKDGSFGFSIDLENGLTAKVRGYKKDGRHFIEGSYSLFANEGDPVNITYIADNDAPEVKHIEQPTTDTIPGLLSLDESNTTPTTET